MSQFSYGLLNDLLNRSEKFCQIKPSNYSFSEVPFNDITKAIKGRNFEKFLKCLIDGKNINSTNSNGYTPLHFACFKMCIPMVYLLIKFGAEINKKSNDGCTPLDCSVSFTFHLDGAYCSYILIEHKAERCLYSGTHELRSFYSWESKLDRIKKIHNKSITIHDYKKNILVDFIKEIIENFDFDEYYIKDLLEIVSIKTHFQYKYYLTNFNTFLKKLGKKIILRDSARYSPNKIVELIPIEKEEKTSDND